uniref:RF_PROK_I domain-containing protein n=1 Tax=Steinernema glaseri TaxID=37863 RepID=A0A1I8A5S4_9BILA
MHSVIRSARRFSSAYREILSTANAEKFFDVTRSRLNDTKTGASSSAASSTDISYWQDVVEKYGSFHAKIGELSQLQKMSEENSGDGELKALIEADKQAIESEIEESASSAALAIVPLTDIDVLSKCQMEFTSGVGGTEAMLFAGELMEMYRGYAMRRGWRWNQLQVETAALGGLRSALVSVEGEGVYRALRFEAGVHRVQRIPVTDKSRMHTSTASISVLPEPEDVSVVIPSTDVSIEAMRASGPGGQNVNKRSTAVRVTHKPTGIAVHCMDERFQHLNIQIAFQRLAAIIMQQRVDSVVEKSSSDRKLQVGSKARAEKVRTYNFKDDRVTDHRLRMSFSNLEEFMQGGEGLHHFIERLDEMHMMERLEEILNAEGDASRE